MKRHSMAGDSDTHGTHEFFRHGGSIGCRLTPGRVHKGKRMSGLMGNVKCTASDLVVVKVLEDKDLVLVKGAVPGAANGLVLIKGSVKDVKKYVVPRADQRGRVEEPDEGLQEGRHGRRARGQARQEVTAAVSVSRDSRAPPRRVLQEGALLPGSRRASVYKLEEIDRRLRLMRAGDRVLDLGCRPGSWLQYALKVGRPARRGGRHRPRPAARSRYRARASCRATSSRRPTPSCSGRWRRSTSCCRTWRPNTTGIARDRSGALGGAVRGGADARGAAAGARGRVRRQDLPGPRHRGTPQADGGPVLGSAHGQARGLAGHEHRDLPGGQRLRLIGPRAGRHSANGSTHSPEGDIVSTGSDDVLAGRLRTTARPCAG